MPLLLRAILAKMSRLSTMKASTQFHSLLPTVLGHVPNNPTEVALSCVLCLVLVALVVLVVLVVLITLIPSPLGVCLLRLSFIGLDFLLPILILSLQQCHVYQALESGPHGYV